MSAKLDTAVMQSWTPQQQLDTLAELARIVMARQKVPSIKFSGPDQSEIHVMQTPEFKVSIYTPRPDETELIERCRRAKDPKNCIALEDVDWDKELEGIDQD